VPEILFQPSGRRVTVPAGTGLLDAARTAGIDTESPCGGKGTCGKCIVRIATGEVDSQSLGVLAPGAVSDGYVLACRTRVLDEPLTVEIPEQIGRAGGKFSDSSADARLVRHELLPQRWHYDPLAVKCYLEVPEPEAEGGLSDLDRVVRALLQQWGKAEVRVTLPVLRRLATALRAEAGRITTTLVRESGCLHLIAVEAGDTTVRHFGIAVDVGTTTIAVQLVYLPLAEIVAVRSDYNDQISCGLDVISRINYARRPDRLEDLRRRVLDTVNRLILQVCESHDVNPHEISNAILSGNTVMTHLLLGLNPEHIRIAPYTPTLHETPFLNAGDVGLQINPESWVAFSPCVGSYVGGDITAGVLCTDLATDTEAVSLFIDIGTNGEIVVGNRDFLITCACSAGPAFEGGGIGCGMRAALGAIEGVEVDPETGQADWRTIGNVKPKGICGSGMISLLAGLFSTGWIDAAGKFDRSRPSPIIHCVGRRATYTLVAASESDSGQALLISETDIENIIRAKAAIYSACALLVKQVGLNFTDLAHVYIAGGFGRFLDLDQATTLGLIPDLPSERFQYIGNSSLMGSYIVLVSQEYRQLQLELARRMTYVELSTDPTYMDQYTGALFIPHTDPERFPTVRARLTGER
jgi:uncharacterized 2Fe-2S/4Fe-4S cluster protein (DUF4445 family)